MPTMASLQRLTDPWLSMLEVALWLFAHGERRKTISRSVWALSMVAKLLAAWVGPIESKHLFIRHPGMGLTKWNDETFWASVVLGLENASMENLVELKWLSQDVS
jgi:hypothetical protein